MHRNAGRGSYVHPDFRGIVHPHFVFDDLRIEPGVAESLCHVIGGGPVFGRASHMRNLRERTKMLLRKFGIRHSKEAYLGGFLGSGVAKAEDGLRARQFLWRTTDR